MGREQVSVVSTVVETTTYRTAAEALWGEAGTYVHDTYDLLRPLYPGLPEQLPIVIGITAYGHVIGLCACTWEYGPRITIASWQFSKGRLQVADIITHEMLHASLHMTGQATDHGAEPWYREIRRLSPVILGHELDARRGADRKSVRVPNPAWHEGGDEPKTLVRKVRVQDAVQHGDVARWPQSFRPDDYDWGTPIRCPSY